MYSPPPTPTTLGALVGEFPGSSRRYLDFLGGAVVIAVALANANGVFGSIVTLDGTSQTLTATTVLFVLLGLACFGDFFFRLRGLHAWLYQYGFAIRRGYTTTAYRMEDIAAIQTWVKTVSFLYIIPISRSRYTALVMKSGEKIKLPPWYYSDANRLSQSIRQMWSQSAAQRKGMPAAPQALATTTVQPPVPLYALPSGSLGWVSPSAIQPMAAPTAPPMGVPPPVPQPGMAAYSQPYGPPYSPPPVMPMPAPTAPPYAPPMMVPGAPPAIHNGQTLITP
ncbi:MAG: hypothetical protein ACRDGS_08050, partial [Chloroflexota bacterium]